ncbi:ABC transporter permease subunit [Methylobacterium nodulans]|uniref:Binding-protein-dependent transport systems inner membrane component n=1 Tax=Methylobacterium nodulans (strain LMG 21967 / CNCM I-2342 / ORS 2060) TaxID=460265 RepID=B8IT08_METNO|nr:ABC transporter permease subunit [Methylobacterium nodulans]ACL55070.1 binding-protein-dependent transport systems inner membrane component [Methylobacterium nodulans ORS 2060]
MSPRWSGALGTAAIGLLLAALAHPAVAGLVARAAGLSAGAPVPLDRLLWLAQRHLFLALAGFALAGGLGLALGILATRTGGARLRGPIDALAAAAQAAPPVVVIGLALPVLGFGAPPTLLALACYGLMPVLRATSDALGNVPEEVRAAAIAMGLTPAQLFWRVDLPLAAGPILAALRVAMVVAVATAAVGALAGAPTLGTPIVVGLQNQNGLPLLQGAAAAAALAFLADAVVLAVEAVVRRPGQDPS